MAGINLNSSVAWIPNESCTPSTSEEVLHLGGRIVDNELSEHAAEQVLRCLTIGTEGNGLGGKYVVVPA